MTWGTLGHSRDIEPLLVRLYDSHRLYQLAENDKPEARAELSHIVSGLLDMQLKPTEKELIADIMINLMRQAEKDLRYAIAERLSVLDNVPLRLVLFMAQDEIGVAETILRTSPVLNELDLLYIIQSRDSDYWRAIAGRKTLNEPVIDALADTRDIPTACALVDNTDIKLSQYAVSVMSDVAKESKDLARPLMARPEIPEVLVRQLYQVISQEMERTIAATVNNELSVLQSVKDVLYEFSPQAQNEFMPTPAMIKAAQMFVDKKQLTPDLMVKTLKRGQIPSFVAQISCYSGLAVPKILTHLRQENGQAMAVICRMLNFNRDDYIGVYLMTQKMRDGFGKLNHGEFNRAVYYFEKLGMEQAKRLFDQYKIS